MEKKLLLNQLFADLDAIAVWNELESLIIDEQRKNEMNLWWGGKIIVSFAWI
jgi:hypothetical protein